MRVSAIGCTALLLLAVAACGGRGGGEETGTTASGKCQGQNTTGITDKTLKLGGIYPLCGPASAYGDIPKGM